MKRKLIPPNIPLFQHSLPAGAQSVLRKAGILPKHEWKFKPRKLFIITIAFTWCFSSFSQLNNFQQWSIEEGLPQTNVYSIRQDAYGYLWIGTEGGLSRFDGKKFKTFTKKDGLAGNTVRSIYSDSKGTMWIGTSEGISYYDGVKFKTINAIQGLKGNAILSFCEDHAGRIWAGSDDGGVNIITRVAKDSVSIRVLNEEKGGLSNPSVFDIYRDKHNNLWLATFGGINLVSFQKDSFSVRILRPGRDIPAEKILCIQEDRSGTLWFGTYQEGAFSLDISGADSGSIQLFTPLTGFGTSTVWDILTGNTNEIWFATGENGLGRMNVYPDRKPEVVFYMEKHGMPDNQVLCMTQDSEGNIWMGTNGNGLCRYSGDQFSHFTGNEGLSNLKVQGIDQDEQGNYWAATDGGGIFRLSFANGEPVFENFNSRQGLLSDFVTSISAGKSPNNKNIWIGTSNRGMSKFDGKKFTNFSEDNGFPNNWVNCVYVDKNGIVWCGTAQGIVRYDGVKFLEITLEEMKMSDDGVKTIIQDKKENIWFGTAGGLARYSGNGKIRTFDEVEGLSHRDVNCLAEDRNGNIWIGTNGGGLYVYDAKAPDSSSIRFIADDSLLSSNSINSLVFANENTLIAGTDKGFDKITIGNSGKVVRMRSYNSSDGFTGVECNDNAIYRDAKGYIWFGTVKGITCFNPNAERTSIPPPKIHITGLQLAYKNIDWASKSDSVVPWFSIPHALELSHSENRLTFHFSGISLSNPEKIRYNYKLEGWDEDWSPERKDGEVTYTGLTPGTYTLSVITVNAEGKHSSSPAQFVFTINPPWYRTTWFYTLSAILSITLIYLYIKWRERSLKEEKRILEEKVAERTHEVVMQKEQIQEKNREITDSINYAKGIQDAILPADEEMKKHFPESFILFKPRDIVSGDFYWLNSVHQKGGTGKIIFAAVDCTGHGVPGAFVSILGANNLNRAVNEYGISEPEKILDKLCEMMDESMSKNHRRDGMDMALCTVEAGLKNARFAGANNPLYIIRKKDVPFSANGKPLTPAAENENLFLYEIKADKQPIGYFESRKNFTGHSFDLLKGDTLYVFSDGYADQFGGPSGKKFKYSSFKKLLLSVYGKSLDEQKELLNSVIEEWKGTLEQVDDICVVGVRM